MSPCSDQPEGDVVQHVRLHWKLFLHLSPLTDTLMLLKKMKQTLLEACLSHKQETLVYKGGIACNIHVSQVFLTSNPSEMKVVNPGKIKKQTKPKNTTTTPKA